MYLYIDTQFCFQPLKVCKHNEIYVYRYFLFTVDYKNKNRK